MTRRRWLALSLVTVLACGSAADANPAPPRPLDRKAVTRPRRDGERWCFTIDVGTDDNVDTQWTGEFTGGGKPVPNSAFVIARADKTSSYACGKRDDAPTRTVRIYPPGSTQR